jgi:hypothetical protein
MIIVGRVSESVTRRNVVQKWRITPSLIRPAQAYSLQLPLLSMPSFTASAAAKVGTGLLTVW